MNTPCECPLSGYCNRHKVTKNDTEHRLCSTEQKYFDMWERKVNSQNVNDKPEVKKEPGLIKKAGNFIKAVSEHVGSGLEEASDEIKEKRASICDTCPLLDRENYRCNKCGCYLKFKISWKTSSCPEGKW
jgi:hypothetical protein